VKTAPDQLIESFRYTLVSRQTFNEYKAAYKRNAYDDCNQRAHIFYYLVRSCFGARMRGSTFGTGRGRNNLGIENMEQDIMQAYARLKTVVIENVGFERILKTYDGRTACSFWIRRTGTRRSMQPEGLRIHSMRPYSRCVKSLRAGLSYINDDAFIREMFSGFNIIGAMCGIRSAGSRAEGAGMANWII
jgi:DNA adenine methylase